MSAIGYVYAKSADDSAGASAPSVKSRVKCLEIKHGITQEFLRDILHYDPSTGEWTWRSRADVGARWNTRNVGTRAGRNRDGWYCQIRINGVSFLGHRLAWLYMTGSPAQYEVDHIYGDPSNNKFSNLRAATNSQNQANRKLSSTNKSGFKGVFWRENRRKWVASIKVGGKSIHLGHFDTAQEARAVYSSAAMIHFGEFARFS